LLICSWSFFKVLFGNPGISSKLFERKEEQVADEERTGINTGIQEPEEAAAPPPKPRRHCQKCDIYDPDSTHCHDCDVCIEEIDHHCIFFGKCIAENN